MPDRIIRARCTSSPTLQGLSDSAERAWWRLTVEADDYGRFEADPDVLLAVLFKRKPHGWVRSRVERSVQEWAKGDDPLVHLYRVHGDSRTYGHVVSWDEHQRERESKPKYPDPPCQNLPQLAARCGESLQVNESVGTQLAISEVLSESKVLQTEQVLQRKREEKGGDARGGKRNLGSEMFSSNSLPPWFCRVLEKSPVFSPLAHGDAVFWKAMSEAYDPYTWLKWDEQIQKADAWIAANPQRRPRALKRFIRNWFERAVDRGRKYAPRKG